MSKRKTHEEFLEEVQAKNPTVNVLGKYINSHTKIHCECKICNFKWDVTPAHLIHNVRKCPKCTGRYKTQEDFEKQVSQINSNIQVLGSYVNSKTKICFKCNICEHEWFAIPTSVLDGTGCPSCAGNIKLTHEEFVNRLNKKKPNIAILGKYVNCKTKVLCRCKICNYEWETTPFVLNKEKHGCPSCANVARKSHDSFIEELNGVNPNIEIKSTYKSIKSKILCECRICKHQWYSTGDALLRDRGCPKCYKSKGEEKIETFLTQNNIEYTSQKTFQELVGVNNGLLRFDFYLPTYNIAIEYQGQFHDGNTNGNIQTETELQIQQEHDNRKREYAKHHNIELLEIWYWDYKNIEQILESRLLLQSA